MTGDACNRCGFKLWLPVARLTVASIGLYDDARYPGRCLLVYQDHVEHLEELTASDACAFLEDARRAGSAIRGVAGAVARVNYAVLGNTEPHLHMHLVPRRADEPRPERSPWEHPDPVAPLGGDRVSRIVAGLRAALA